ncbi:SDR family oxidoreductase [Taklimakanibacter deserti]|uniref:SDR family oxidoreductase n=1 Tax=Taklimakanibacter deserti TaxID=2267839 RepID=UPI000E653844
MALQPYRSALVTGGSKGIGAAICRKLRERDLTVYAVARNREALQDLARSIGIIPVVADVRDTAALVASLKGAEIDILVNNAGGLATVRPLHLQTAAEIRDTIDLNLTAPLQLVQALLPGMIGRKRGHVFNITSTAGHAVFPGTVTYGAAKAGLAHAGSILRYDLAGSNVRITEVSPGRVETEFYLQAFGGDRQGLKQKMYTEQRALTPDDVAAVIAAALAMPQHADLARISVEPTDQATGGHIYGTFHPE